MNEFKRTGIIRWLPSTEYERRKSSIENLTSAPVAGITHWALVEWYESLENPKAGKWVVIPILIENGNEIPEGYEVNILIKNK